MDLKISDILSLPEYEDIIFVAGRGGVDRVVKGANIIEVPTVTHWMRGGEILFSSGYAFGGDQEQGCKLLQELSHHNIAALVLKPGDYLHSIGEDMKRCANLLNFPLLAIPEDQPYSHYIDSIYSLLLNQKAKTLEASNSICSHLFNIVVDQSYEALCKFVSESLRQPIFLLDMSGNILDGSTEENQSYREAFSMLSSQANDRFSFINQYLYRSGTEEIRVLYISIESPQKRVAYLTAVETAESDHELTCAVLPFVARIVQIQEIHVYSLLQQENRIAGDLLGDIIEKRFEDPNIILQRGRMLHVDLASNLAVIVIHFSDTNCELSDLRNRVRTEKFNLRQVVREKIVNILPRTLFLDHADSIVALIQVDDSTDSNHLQYLLKSALGSNSDSQIKLSIGISRVIKGIKDVPLTYDQAKIASKIASNKKDEISLLCYDNLGISRVFPELDESFELAQLIKEKIGPIVQFDRENQTDYLSTLRTFYLNNGVISQTAKELFIHKNTMIKYLHTLESIVGCDLRNYKTVMEIMFCLEAFDLFDEFPCK